jgi:hypothetical protein
MTNPGHIDPGYHGNLRFTVINMSAQLFPLRTGDAIVTLLIDKLAKPVTNNFQQRTGPCAVKGPGWDEVNLLAKDFVNVEERAKKIANDAGIKWTLIISAFGTIATLIATLIIGHVHNSDVDDLKAKIGVLEERINNVKLDDRLSDLEKKFAATKVEDRPKDLGMKVNKK